MKILFSVELKTPGTIDEVLAKIEEEKGEKVTKAQAEEKFYNGLKEMMENETDDEMEIVNITCNWVEE